ncbi:MAG TPA: FtsK/SpoIIIE domain-containing protein [Anaerolineae bacterium]|nr:FtsK/SpoIIIE domain-containing protein [Anaerolineae bacterium]
MVGYSKDPETGLWKRGDNPGGMDLGPVNWRSIGVAVGVIIVLAIALWLDARANDAPQWRPDRAAWPGWHILGVVVVALLALLAVAAVIWVLHTVLVSMSRRAHDYRVQRERDADETERQKKQNGTTHLAEALAAAHIPAEGALVRITPAGWQVVNLGAEKGSVLMGDDGTVRRTLHDDLSVAQIAARFEVERTEAKARAFPALHTLQQRSDGKASPDVPAGPPPAAWPRVVRLHEIAADPPSLHRLALGVTVDESGQQQSVTASLAEMVHVAVGGSSGWGKSVFLKALALQLATAAEPVHMAMVDLEGVTFSAFATCSRLLWPVAETEGQALAIMALLVEEMDRRSQLFREVPGVDSLAAYNARAGGDEPLAPWVALIDEATALLSDRGVLNAARTLVLRARKYGLWMVLGGQDWKSASIDTAIRNQLSSRVQFRAQDAAQSRTLLGDGVASTIEVVGRAYAQLPGRPMLQLLAPMVTGADIGRALAGQTGPAGELPEAAEGDDGRAARIRELAGQGWSQSAIEEEVFGYRGGAAHRTVRDVLNATTATATTSPGRNGGKGGRG